MKLGKLGRRYYSTRAFPFSVVDAKRNVANSATNNVNRYAKDRRTLTFRPTRRSSARFRANFRRFSRAVDEKKSAVRRDERRRLYCQSAQNRQIAKFNEKRQVFERFSPRRATSKLIENNAFITHGNGSSVRNRWRLK